MVEAGRKQSFERFMIDYYDYNRKQVDKALGSKYARYYNNTPRQLDFDKKYAEKLHSFVGFDKSLDSWKKFIGGFKT
jgi:hypothetical protein